MGKNYRVVQLNGDVERTNNYLFIRKDITIAYKSDTAYEVYSFRKDTWYPVTRSMFEILDGDGCKICKGWNGGTPGNENVEDGVVICDYCSSKKKGEQV